MNLVAKEYCAANIDKSGVLILSESAGAASQLRRNSLLVNPYDIEGVANAIHRAYHMSVNERQMRMQRLRKSIAKRDIFWWVDFLRWQVSRGLRGDSIYPMWNRVGIWSYAIHNGFPKYKDIDSYPIAAQGLRHIGMTNLKKSGGGSVSNIEAIRKYAETTINLWKKNSKL